MQYYNMEYRIPGFEYYDCRTVTGANEDDAVENLIELVPSAYDIIVEEEGVK